MLIDAARGLESIERHSRLRTMGKKVAARSRDATMEEVDEALRNAGDYVGSMIFYEKAASDATAEAIRTKDFDRQSECLRLFVRDYSAFADAGRTAWNYMIQAVETSGSRKWLDERVAQPLYTFHRDVKNQVSHKYGLVFGMRQTVKVEGTIPVNIPRPPIYGLPAKAFSVDMSLDVTDFINLTYHYNPDAFEPDVAALCKSMMSQYPNESVVLLATRYVEGLRQVFKSGLRRGRFVRAVL